MDSGSVGGTGGQRECERGRCTVGMWVGGEGGRCTMEVGDGLVCVCVWGGGGAGRGEEDSVRVGGGTGGQREWEWVADSRSVCVLGAGGGGGGRCTAEVGKGQVEGVSMEGTGRRNRIRPPN